MQDVKYARAQTTDEAISLLQKGGLTARVLAGGTDVIVQARERRRDIDLFVDIKAIAETQALTYSDDGGLTIGAARPCYLIYDDAAVMTHYSALVQATSVIGGIAIQGRASLGGNLCNAPPAGDTLPAMIALEGVANIAGPGGRRSLPVEQFVVAPGRNALQPGEFVVSIHFPPQRTGSGSAWERFIPRNEMDIAVVNAAANLQLDDGRVTWARIAIGAVAPTPLLVEAAEAALVGRPLSDESIAAAAAAARDAASPIDDMRGSVKQRKHLVAVLVERTIREAARRAAGGN